MSKSLLTLALRGRAQYIQIATTAHAFQICKLMGVPHTSLRHIRSFLSYMTTVGYCYYGRKNVCYMQVSQWFWPGLWFAQYDISDLRKVFCNVPLPRKSIPSPSKSSLLALVEGIITGNNARHEKSICVVIENRAEKARRVDTSYTIEYCGLFYGV